MSLISSVAERDPSALGVNVTRTVQLWLPARLAPQLFVSAKSPALVPLIEMPEIEIATLPVFVTVMGTAVLVFPTFSLPKFTPVADSSMTVPTPDSLIDCGLRDALSVTVSVPVLLPMPVGVKIT